jgi:hypothetical protein
MNWIRASQWAIRIVLVASFVGIVVVALIPELTIESRVNSIGAALQIAGVALAIPELAHRLSNKSATDLLVWAETFTPLWKILSKIHIVKNLGQLSIILSVKGIILILAGLFIQYSSAYFN